MMRRTETDKRNALVLNDVAYEFIPTETPYECHCCDLAKRGCRMRVLHGAIEEEPAARYLYVNAACTSIFGVGCFRMKEKEGEYALRLDRRRFYMNSMLDGKLYDSVLRALKRVARSMTTEEGKEGER